MSAGLILPNVLTLSAVLFSVAAVLLLLAAWGLSFIVRLYFPRWPESLRDREILSEAFLTGSRFLLAGSLLVEPAALLWRCQSSRVQAAALTLAMFLLGVGVVWLLQCPGHEHTFLSGFSGLVLVFDALIRVAIAPLPLASLGDAPSLAVPWTSVSYVVVPAVVCLTVPEACCGLRIPMAPARHFHPPSVFHFTSKLFNNFEAGSTL